MDAEIIGYIEQHLVLLLQGLHLIMNLFFSLAELLENSIALGNMSIQLFFGLSGVEFIVQHSGSRLVPALWVF